MLVLDGYVFILLIKAFSLLAWLNTGAAWLLSVRV